MGKHSEYDELMLRLRHGVPTSQFVQYAAVVGDFRYAAGVSACDGSNKTRIWMKGWYDYAAISGSYGITYAMRAAKDITEEIRRSRSAEEPSGNGS